MAEQDDAQVQEIRARLEAATPGPWLTLKRAPDLGATEIGAQLDTPDARVIADTELWGRKPTEQNVQDAAFIAHAREDVPYLLARLDALTAERDVLRVERDIARRVEQESSAAADAWQAEAVKVRAERDALAARLAAAESLIDEMVAGCGLVADIYDEDGNLIPSAPHPGDHCDSFGCGDLERLRAALAGSREQAAATTTTRTITMRCHCGRGVTIGPDPWCEGCVQSAATCDCVPVVIGEGA